MQPPSILIVEDDRSLAGLIADYLVEHGFRALVESRGDRAVWRILDERPSLVVLDIMLPGEDGLSVCRKVRNHYPGPIVMLTARGNEPDEVTGLEIGADDYLAKPVRPRVLLARLRALLRRPPTSVDQAGPPSQALTRVDMGELSIDKTIREASVRGALLPLTSGEFDLLWLLVSHAGEPLSRKAMHRGLCGAEYDDFDRAIDLRVSRLRQKLGDATSGQEVIKTVRGVGYLYVKR